MCFSFFMTYLLLCWWKAPPPPEVCTRASVCADVVPLWNVQHSPDSHLLYRHRHCFPRTSRAHRHCCPPGSSHCDPHLLPCWASSEAQLAGELAAELKVCGTSPVHRPLGSGCTRSLLHHPHRSPLLGPHSEGEDTPWPDRR